MTIVDFLYSCDFVQNQLPEAYMTFWKLNVLSSSATADIIKQAMYNSRNIFVIVMYSVQKAFKISLIKLTSFAGSSEL